MVLHYTPKTVEMSQQIESCRTLRISQVATLHLSMAKSTLWDCSCCSRICAIFRWAEIAALKFPADKLCRYSHTRKAMPEPQEETSSPRFPLSPGTQCAHFSEKSVSVRSSRRRPAATTEARLGLPVPAVPLSHQAVFILQNILSLFTSCLHLIAAASFQKSIRGLSRFCSGTSQPK